MTAYRATFKGQLISEANCQAMKSFQKTNEWIRFYYYATCFRSFFWENPRPWQFAFEINWPLDIKANIFKSKTTYSGVLATNFKQRLFSYTFSYFIYVIVLASNADILLEKMSFIFSTYI